MRKLVIIRANKWKPREMDTLAGEQLFKKKKTVLSPFAEGDW